MSRHQIVIEGNVNDEPGFTHCDYKVTCVDSGARFYLYEPDSPYMTPEFSQRDTAEMARYFMNGKDGRVRCEGKHQHVLLGAVKR